MKIITEEIDLYSFLDKEIRSAWEKYKLELIRCKSYISEEAVHDLRVSIRRLITVINAVITIHSDIYSIEIKKILKKQLKLFSTLRDTQVQILFLRKFYYSHPVLYNFYVKLLAKEKELVNGIVNDIRKINQDDLQGLFLFFRMNLIQTVLKNKPNITPLVENSEAIYILLLDSIESASQNDPASIHTVRLVFKKFRYSMEILEGILKIPKALMKNMHTFQTLLGEIQDATVLLRDLKVFVSTQKELPEVSYNAALMAIKDKQEILIDTFFESTSLVKLFWKKEWI
jgi:CHAD domain-containing protein